MATLIDVGSVGAYFESLEDPRHTRNRRHLLADIIGIAVCGIIGGCDGPTAIHRRSTLREGWLKQRLTLPNGLPSRDCLRRLLMALKPEAFQECFRRWAAGAFPPDPDGKRRLAAIDGKTRRGSRDAPDGLGMSHPASAWAGGDGIALGRVATAAKSDGITAIPELLKQPDLSDAIVAIDAMGCQKEIAARIAAGGGECVIAVTDNRPTLAEATETHSREATERDPEDSEYRHAETRDAGHGRSDTRSHCVAKVPEGFAVKERWPSAKGFGYARRETRHDDGRTAAEVRYHISRRCLSGKRGGEAGGRHWSIESMHWVSDVNFRADDSRTRERTLGNNLSWLRRFAVTMLKRHPKKDSLRGKMIRCGVSTSFLTDVLLREHV